MLIKTFLSIGIGVAVAVSPLRDSSLVKLLIILTGG